MYMSNNYVPASGSSSPLIYLVGEAPGLEEDKGNEPFIGPAGRWCKQTLTRIGYDLSTVRWHNVVPYLPFEWHSGRRRHRTPTDSEITGHSLHCRRDIINKKPKMIVLFGRSARKGILGVHMKPGRGSIISHKDYPFAHIGYTWHPSYIAHHSEDFDQDCEQWIRQMLYYKGVADTASTVINTPNTEQPLSIQLSDAAHKMRFNLI